MSDFDRQGSQYSTNGAWAANGHTESRPLTASETSVAERVAFIRKVYALFFAATLFAIGGVFVGYNFPPLMMAAARYPLVMFLVMIGGIYAAQAVRHKPGINLVALFGFTTLTGVVISPVLFVISRTNPASITQSGLLTVGIFGGLTAYVFLTRRDFSFLRGMLTVGLIVIVLGGLMNYLVVGSLGIGFALAVGALLLFSGYVLYDTSNIMRRYPTSEYVAAALAIYLDAFNIFLAVLRLLNSGRR
ncbi:MAG: Bax inhibitor-1 family protein [Blastocatellia bacterium]